MYIYCLAHVLLAYYPPAPPGLPPLCPRNAWTLSSRQRQIQTQCKKANTNWPTAPLALPPIYLVLQRSLEANQDRRSISHNARSSVSISVGFETTTMANNVSAANKGMQLQGKEITFVLCRQSLKDGWSTDTHIFIDKTMAGSLFIWDSLSVSAHLGSCFVPDSHLFPFTQMCK